MNTREKLFDFINASPTAYHAVDNICKALASDGYTELYEGEKWTLTEGGKYYVKRNGTSVIAFRKGKEKKGFMIASSHSDSPAFRLKLSAEALGEYARLDTERYGGAIHYTWLDRPLSLAGRVVVRTECGVRSELVNIDSDIAVIPSVAIHFNRAVNDGYKFNPAKDLIALIGSSDKKGSLLPLIADKISCDKDNIIAHDLFLYNRDKAKLVGIDKEYILSPRLDDLECVFGSLEGFLSASVSDSTPVLAVFDNEEVGSSTKQGAASTFLYDVLSRIAGNEDNYYAMLSESFMVSADNAHAKHPNFPELSDASNAPIMNKGIVIKHNASQRYATDGVSSAIFTEICKRAGVPTQNYYNRADMPGGSTLGSISNTVVSIPTVDIGLAQLAMHSSSELAGASDAEYLTRAFDKFFSVALEVKGNTVDIK